MRDVVLYRRGNVWQCRTGTVKLLAAPVSTDDCRRSVVALVPHTELDNVPSLTIKLKTLPDFNPCNLINHFSDNTKLQHTTRLFKYLTNNFII